jgi:hypothetical protein
MKILRTIFLPIIVILLFAAPARSQTVEFPASWEGIWDFNITEKDCTTSAILDSYSERDTICAGSTINDGAQECFGFINDTEIDVVCNQTTEPFPDCVVAVTVTIQGAKSGNSINAQFKTTTTYTPSCGIPDSCVQEDLEGTFVSTNPGLCPSVALGDESWGAWKARY